MPNGPEDVAAAAKKVAKVDEIIPWPDPRRQTSMQILQAPGLTMDRADGPGQTPRRKNRENGFPRRGGSGFHTILRDLFAGLQRAGSRGRQQFAKLLARLLLVDPLQGRELANQAVKSGLVDLPLTERLVRLTNVGMQVTDDFGD